MQQQQQRSNASGDVCKLAQLLVDPRRVEAVMEYSIKYGTGLFQRVSAGGGSRKQESVHAVCTWLSSLTRGLSAPCTGNVRIFQDHFFLSERVCFPVKHMEAEERALFGRIYKAPKEAGFASVGSVAPPNGVAFDDAVPVAFECQRCVHNQAVGEILSQANLLITCVLLFMYKLVSVEDRFGAGFKTLQLTLDHQKRVGESCHLAPILHSLFFTWQAFRADPSVELWHQVRRARMPSALLSRAPHACGSFLHH